MLISKALRRSAMPIAAAGLLTLAGPAQAGSVDMGDFKFTWTGFIKLDAFVTDYSNGNVSSAQTFYVPNAIPVTGASEDPVFSSHARQTRFIFRTDGDVGGRTVTGYLEFDFMGAGDGNQIVTNAFQPNLRHAFFRYDNWMFGQFWTNFQNPGSLPDSVDFLGPSESVVFIRQPQIRYSNGNFHVSVENAESLVTSGAGNSSTGRGHFPDFTARYVFSGDWGNVHLAGLVRNIENLNDDKWGASGSVTGLFKVGATDDIRFSLSYGTGMGRYLGIATFADAGVDGAGNLDLLDLWGGNISYRRVWNSQWRSSLIYGYAELDNPAFLGPGVNKTAWSVAANLIHTPFPKVDIGVEYRFAERELEGGDKGDMSRFQFTARYSF